MRALWLVGILLWAGVAAAQVFSPSQEAELRLKYLQTTGGISGTLVLPNSLPADRVVGTGVTFATQAGGDITGSYARLYFNSRAEPRLQGLTLGSATSRVPGTLRFNAVTGLLQLYGYSGWEDVAGSGSGFPLTADGDLAGFSLTNGGSVVATSGVFQTLGSSPQPQANLIYTPTGYTHAYHVRYVTNYGDWATQQANTNPATLYPGQLVYQAANGNTYYVNAPIHGTNYAPFTTNTLPYPGVSTNFTLFVAKGAAGATGASGSNTVYVATNFNWSVWSGVVVYDTGTPTVVQYGSRWWHALLNSTNRPPDVNTNYWEVSVDKGDDGQLMGTNLVMRGNWNPVDTYASNDVVAYAGNLFYVYTNDFSGANHVPALNSDSAGTNSPFWDVLVSRGIKGATGANGADGADGTATYITNLFNAFIITGNTVIANTPTSNDVVQFDRSEGTPPENTNYYRWRFAPSGLYVTSGVANAVHTNADGSLRLTLADAVVAETDPLWSAVSNRIQFGTNFVAVVDGTNITINGQPYGGGGGGGGGGAASSTVYVTFGTRFEGHAQGGSRPMFGPGIDVLSIDSSTQYVDFGATVFTPSTAVITNELYGRFTPAVTSGYYQFYFAATQPTGMVILKTLPPSVGLVSTQIITAANTIYRTNMLVHSGCTGFKLVFIYNTTNSANWYRIGVGQ